MELIDSKGFVEAAMEFSVLRNICDSSVPKIIVISTVRKNVTLEKCSLARVLLFDLHLLEYMRIFTLIYALSVSCTNYKS